MQQKKLVQIFREASHKEKNREINLYITFRFIFLSVTSQAVFAEDDEQDCPVGLLNELTLDAEYDQ